MYRNNLGFGGAQHLCLFSPSACYGSYSIGRLSRKPGSHSFEKPSILLVAQPDDSMPGAWKEMALVRRLNPKVTTLVSKRATPSAVIKRLEDHRFAHFSCHGILETRKPSMLLSNFMMASVLRCSTSYVLDFLLRNSHFSCHTSELTEDSIADEGLHLLLQYNILDSGV